MEMWRCGLSAPPARGCVKPDTHGCECGALHCEVVNWPSQLEALSFHVTVFCVEVLPEPE